MPFYYPFFCPNNKRNNNSNFNNFNFQKMQNNNFNYFEKNQINSKKIEKNQKKSEKLENDNFSDNFDEYNYYFNLFGLNLYFDDILIICILFFLYNEHVHDEELFLCLILLLLS